MRLVDLPRYVSAETYAVAVRDVSGRLIATPGVEAVFQFGHTRTPGISDVDLLVVFSDAASLRWQPRQALSGDLAYVFAHDLFGITRRHYAQALERTFFHNFKLIAGERSPETPSSLASSDLAILRSQTALEYMLRMYVSLGKELNYRVLQIRRLFLRSSALLYDLEFLAIVEGPLFEAIHELVSHREKWFEAGQATNERLWRDAEHLFVCLGEFLGSALREHKFALPLRREYRLDSNVRISAGRYVRLSRRGVRLPSRLSSHEDYFRAQNVINHFKLTCPFSTVNIPESLMGWFDLRARMSEVNASRFPHFLPLASSFALR